MPDSLKLASELGLGSILHPTLRHNFDEWEKWRLSYEGGKQFIHNYLKKLSDDESDDEFLARKHRTFVPRFAAAAIDDIKNSIFQRICDVKRVGGPKSYQQAIKGHDEGVDLEKSDMNSFIGTKIITELLIMSRVGVLTDNFDDLGSTQLDKGSKRPFLKTYVSENIINWRKHNGQFIKLLLRESIEEFNNHGLPSDFTTRFRLYELTEDNNVEVTFFDDDKLDKVIASITLDIERIPFRLFEIPFSLMRDIDDYQIALMNLESTDISYFMRANFPMYFEFFDPKTEIPYQKTPNSDNGTDPNFNKNRELKVGLAKGRRLPAVQGALPPGFTSPDPDNIRASMEKGKQLKEDIRLIANLNLININPRRQSDASKIVDLKPLEASLSYLGLVLNIGEQGIAEDWQMFEPEGDEPSISYPKNYSLKDDSQKREEAKELNLLKNEVPSSSYKKFIAKKIVNVTVGTDLTDAELEKIHNEIDSANTLTSDPTVILESHKRALIKGEDAAVALGYDPSGVKEAEEERARRIKQSLEAKGIDSSLNNDEELQPKEENE